MHGSFRLLFALTVAALPVGLLVESGILGVVLSEASQTGLEALRPIPTGLAWTAVAAASIATGFSVQILNRILEPRLARLPDDQRARPDRREQVQIGAFLLSSSVVQLPGVLALIAHGLGAAHLPSILAVLLSCLAVGRQYRKIAAG